MSINHLRSAWLSMTLIAACSVSHAASYSPPQTDSESNVYAIEKDSMTRKGYIVYAWQLVNLAKPKDGSIRSTRSLVEFNCRFRQMRTMWVNEHPDRDAGGEAISSGQVSNPVWVQVEPGAIAEKLLDFSCSHIMR